MNTFDLESYISNSLESSDVRQLKDVAGYLGHVAVAEQRQRQALEEAIAELLPDDVQDEISERFHEKISAYIWRGVTEDSAMELGDYGYERPMVLLEEGEEIPYRTHRVYLLFEDGTEKLAESAEEIEAHQDNGGLIGIDTLSIEENEFVRRSKTFSDEEEEELNDRYAREEEYVNALTSDIFAF